MADLPDFASHGYRLDAVLGTNPEAGRTAYRGVRLADGEPVVIKRFSFASTDASWGVYESHQREIATLADLDHWRIPTYLADFETDEGFCMVQQFCPAPAMADRSTWDPKQLLALAKSALELLVYLQERLPPIVHRDVKPENILVDDEGTAYLVDFGLARTARAQATTLAVGTPGFMPPEQLLGHALTGATDLYGLGAALMSALTATPSAEIATLVDTTFSFDLSKLPASLSEEFRAWLGQMVAPSLEKRFSSARVALNSLAQMDGISRRAPAPRRSVAPAPQPPPSHVAPDPSPVPPQPEKQRLASKSRPVIKDNFNRVFGIVLGLAATGIILPATLTLEQGPTRPKLGPTTGAGIVCTEKMTYSGTVVAGVRNSGIVAQKGCDLTFNGLVEGNGQIIVDGGIVTITAATFDVKRPGLVLASGGGTVFMDSSIMDCDAQCIQVHRGNLTVNSTRLASEGSAIEVGPKASSVAMFASQVTGHHRALTVQGGTVRLTSTDLASPNLALEVKAPGAVTLQGGRLKGGWKATPTGTLVGLETIVEVASKPKSNYLPEVQWRKHK